MKSCDMSDFAQENSGNKVKLCKIPVPTKQFNFINDFLLNFKLV